MGNSVGYDDGYFKVGNVSCRMRYFIFYVLNPCPCHIHDMSQPYPCHIWASKSVGTNFRCPSCLTKCREDHIPSLRHKKSPMDLHFNQKKYSDFLEWKLWTFFPFIRWCEVLELILQKRKDQSLILRPPASPSSSHFSSFSLIMCIDPNPRIEWLYLP